MEFLANNLYIGIQNVNEPKIKPEHLRMIGFVLFIDLFTMDNIGTICINDNVSSIVTRFVTSTYTHTFLYIVLCPINFLQNINKNMEITFHCIKL